MPRKAQAWVSRSASGSPKPTMGGLKSKAKSAKGRGLPSYCRSCHRRGAACCAPTSQLIESNLPLILLSSSAAMLRGTEGRKGLCTEGKGGGCHEPVTASSSGDNRRGDRPRGRP